MLEILISALVAVVVAYLTARASSYSKDVVEERRNWRESIRELAVKAAEMIRKNEVNTDEYSNIVSGFRLRLNPDDEDDKKIIKCLWNGKEKPDEKVARELLARVARLLKHDWDRSVWETKAVKVPRVGKWRYPPSELRTFKEADTDI
ncbi:hypothetical protein [Aquicoccus sp.]|uniref:hypothetical protein n=1 Tax=Aquicoccus sp. TaxID=2055851 RepID=UPI003561FA32